MELQGEHGLLSSMAFIPSLTRDFFFPFPAATRSHSVYISISSTSGSLFLGQAEMEANRLRRSGGGAVVGGGF